MRGGHVRARAAGPPSSSAPRRHRARAAWGLALAALLGLLFTGLTALTLTLWVTDPAYTETNPVVDLAFFALGGILVTTGLAAQVRTASVAGLQQAVLALAVLAAVGALGGRVEPFVGGAVLLAAVAPLVVSHPQRARLVALGPAGPSRSLAVLAVVAAVPATVYTTGMVAQARAAGPSCFLGQCARGDRYAEAAALAVAVVVVALLATARPPGWRLPAWSAGAAALVLGGASLLLPDEAGALGTAWATATAVWGVTLVTVAEREHRRMPGPGAPRASCDASTPASTGTAAPPRPGPRAPRARARPGGPSPPPGRR